MAFGPIMRFKTLGDDPLAIELAPLTREGMGEFVGTAHGGGMQRLSVTRYLGSSLAPVLEDEQEWFDKVRESETHIVWGMWLVEGDSRTLIGNSSLDGIGEHGNAGFIRQAVSGSLIFRPDYWGRGIASAAHKARAWYAFQYLGLHRINSAVVQDNKGSAIALARTGYTRTYTERNELYYNGTLRHLDYYECLNPLDLFWSQWWHDDQPTAEAQAARQVTLAAMEWAASNVTLP